MRYYHLREFDVPGVDILGKGVGVIGQRMQKTNPIRAPLDNMSKSQDFKGLLHQGVDLLATVGTPLYAPTDGTVTLAKGLKAGLYIVLQTATATHKFMHLSSYAVQDGAKVKAGQIIGKTGNTGLTSGPHLHWEVWVNGKAVDPMNTLKEGALADIMGNVWKKVAGTAEKEVPRIEPTIGKPTSTTPTPIRGETTPRPTPVYTTPVRNVVKPFAAKIAKAEEAGLKLYDLPGTQDKIVQISGRPIVVVDVNGTSMPFYVSTGSGGKAGVPVGQWYPIFGIHPSGWFNKGWTEEQINNYYGSKALAQVAHTLDDILGDVRPYVKEMMDGRSALSVINQGKNPVAYKSNAPWSKEEFEAYQKYVQSILATL